MSEQTTGPALDFDETLGCAVYAADNAVRTMWQLWRSMTPIERERWMKSSSFNWPRADVMLDALLPAGMKIYAWEDENQWSPPGANRP